MEFITYDKSIKRKAYLQKNATININIAGKINFNSTASILLDLYKGGKVIFQQEKERPENWYIKKVPKDNEQGFTPRLAPNATNKGMHFNRAERHGIRIDEKYLKKTHKKLTQEVESLEKEFEKTKFYKDWNKTVTGKPNINSGKQLGKFIYKVQGHEITKKTKTGQGSTDEEALKQLRIPALEILLKIKKVENLRDTFLASLARETVNGVMHPTFGLHIPVTYRGSSYDPNFQNLPKRDEKSMRTIRGAIYPSKGNQLLEVDYGGVEVCIGESYHKDKKMLKYILDPKTDMHRDMATEIFRLKKFDKDSKGHAFLRSATKNGFVFPEFYGDYFKPCAESLICGWGEVDKGKFRPGQGVKIDGLHLSDLLIKNGFKNYQSFEDHIRAIEKDFWGKRFKGYAKWKDEWYADYIVFDVYPPELEKLLNLVRQVTTKDLRKHWDWINVPLTIDGEICDINAPWSEKKKLSICE
jgi:hypothetical protein